MVNGPQIFLDVEILSGHANAIRPTKSAGPSHSVLRNRGLRSASEVRLRLLETEIDRVLGSGVGLGNCQEIEGNP